MLRNLLAVSAMALVLGACNSRSSLGSGGDNLNTGGSSGSGGSSTGGGTGWDPCSGKTCGAECSLCAPSDPNCAETAILKFCSADSKCGQAYPDCGPSQTCKADSDCPAVGAPCQACADGSYACPFSKCEAGQCVSGFDSCQDQCKSDADCPQIGAPCQQCPDGSFACPWTQCVNGQCAGGFEGCKGYDPCGGKQCGDTCSLCAPNDPNCVETAVVKYCDGGGQCTWNYPVCSPNQCKVDGDCPAIELCKPCPNGGCANVACINGACGWECPPPTNPQCKSAADCPATGACKQCPDGSCAVTDCINGACELVCGL